MATQGTFMTAVLFVAALLFSRCATGRPLSPSSSDPDDDDEVSHFVVPLNVAMIVFFAVVALFMLILSKIIQFCNQENTLSYSMPVLGRIISSEKVGFRADELEKFPERLYTEVKELLAGKRAVDCAVCLCEFEDHDQLRLLPGCDHAFHRDCIDTWLASHLTCPFCRANIVDALENSENEIEGCATVVESNSARETSKPRHEVAIVMNLALVAAEEEEEEERKWKVVHEMLELGRRMRRH